MQKKQVAVRVLPLVALTIVLAGSLGSRNRFTHSQDHDLNLGPLDANAQTRERKVQNQPLEVVKVDVDLITIDALVMERTTSRIIGDLTRDDFLLFEDGKRQDITHFSQGTAPLSVLLMIDRGGCLDPFGDAVHHAAIESLKRLRPEDEVAVMTYQNTTELRQPFTRDRSLIERSLGRIPPHDEEANHCLNKAFFDAASYMERAGNPSGRRVVIFITGVTRNFDCADGPGAKAALHAIYESGSVVCALIPVTADQRVENGMMRWATRVGGVMKVPSLNLKDVALETGGEMLEDKPQQLDKTFTTLIDHLRSRFSLAFVSSNKLRDGTIRKLRIEVRPVAEKSRGKLVVRARQSYVAPR